MNSNQSSVSSKIQQNKLSQAKYDPFKIKLLQDKLDPKAKARLETLLQEIDDNMDELLKEKADYAKQGMKGDTKSMMSKMTGVSRTTDANNAYLYSLNDQD